MYHAHESLPVAAADQFPVGLLSLILVLNPLAGLHILRCNHRFQLLFGQDGLKLRHGGGVLRRHQESGIAVTNRFQSQIIQPFFIHQPFLLTHHAANAVHTINDQFPYLIHFPHPSKKRRIFSLIIIL